MVEEFWGIKVEGKNGVGKLKKTNANKNGTFKRHLITTCNKTTHHKRISVMYMLHSYFFETQLLYKQADNCYVACSFQSTLNRPSYLILGWAHILSRYWYIPTVKFTIYEVDLHIAVFDSIDSNFILYIYYYKRKYVLRLYVYSYLHLYFILYYIIFRVSF